jgi:CHASE3 domain sensor protein
VVTLFLAFGLVVCSVTLSIFSTHKISGADLKTAHAQHTLVLINQLQSTMNEAETAQRGYILTRDEKYLAPYEAARPRYKQELAALESQVSADAAKQLFVHELAQLCEARFLEIARTVSLRREHGIAPALNVVESDEGYRLMNEIRLRLESMQRDEFRDIASFSAAAASEARTFQRMNGVLIAVAVLLAGAVAWAVIRRLHQLEGLIKVCAWTQRVQWEGRWITFEEYLAKRFNLHCTHGISDEAAQQLGRDIENTPVPPEIDAVKAAPPLDGQKHATG